MEETFESLLMRWIKETEALIEVLGEQREYGAEKLHSLRFILADV